MLADKIAGGVGIAINRRSNKFSQQARISINEGIRAKDVRVIGPDGNQIGVVPTARAIAAAEEFGLDLVEVSPNARPPVCKIMDYGRYKYELTKKKQEAKKKQTTFQVKEIKVRPKTGDHDLETKVGHIRKFIDKKDKVKVTLMFRGRDLLARIAQEVDDIAVVEQAPKFEGRTMIMVLSPRSN